MIYIVTGTAFQIGGALALIAQAAGSRSDLSVAIMGAVFLVGGTAVRCAGRILDRLERPKAAKA